MENVHQGKNSRTFGSKCYLHATKHWQYSNAFLIRAFFCCRSWNMYSISNYDHNSYILALPLGYIWLPKSVLSFWGIFSWRYPSQILPWVLVYSDSEAVFEVNQMILRANSNLYRNVWRKHSCASSGQVLKAKYEGYPTSMLSWNKEVLSGVCLWFFFFKLHPSQTLLDGLEGKTATSIHIISP